MELCVLHSVHVCGCCHRGSVSWSCCSEDKNVRKAVESFLADIGDCRRLDTLVLLQGFEQLTDAVDERPLLGGIGDATVADDIVDDLS